MIRFISGLITSFLFMVLLDLAWPGTMCTAIERTKGVIKNEKMIVVDEDTLIYNKKTKRYEFKDSSGSKEVKQKAK